MDPASIATITAIANVAFGAVGALINIFKLLKEFMEYRDQRKANLGRDGQEEPKPEVLAAIKLSNLANRLSSRLSRSGPSSTDKRLAKDIVALRKELSDLLQEIRTTKEESTNTRADVDDRTLRSWSKRAMALKQKLESIIAPSSRPNGDNEKVSLEIIQPGPSGSLSNRQFCYGAVLCQHGKATSASLAVKNDKNDAASFTCIHCNLEVGQYESVGLSSKGSPVKTSDLLASCHLMACDAKLRAFYRCLACHLDQKQLDFYTAAGLEAHMEEHPGFSFLPPKLEVVGEEAAKKDMEEFLTREIPSSQSSTDSQTSHLEDHDNTPLSSLGSPTSEHQPGPTSPSIVDGFSKETDVLSPRPGPSPSFSPLSPDDSLGDADTAMSPLAAAFPEPPNDDRRNTASSQPPVRSPNRPAPAVPAHPHGERVAINMKASAGISGRPTTYYQPSGHDSAAQSRSFRPTTPGMLHQNGAYRS